MRSITSVEELNQAIAELVTNDATQPNYAMHYRANRQLIQYLRNEKIYLEVCFFQKFVTVRLQAGVPSGRIEATSPTDLLSICYVTLQYIERRLSLHIPIDMHGINSEVESTLEQ